MLKWIGTLSAVALAATFLEKRKTQELESAAEAELRKILVYAAPPTFLAAVSSVHHDAPRRRWTDRYGA